MTTIVNAYSGNESIANNLRAMAEGIFGYQARQEMLRQTASKYRRENENVPLYANAAAANNRPDMSRYSIMADREQHLPSTSLVTAATAANGNIAEPHL